ncbi:MAG: hypothetical protein SH868_16945 [Bythopirellula sp.]|nr:hypothetical protein [Bythopirellula sp.]
MVTAGLLFLSFAMLGSSDSNSLQKPAETTTVSPPSDPPKLPLKAVTPKSDKQLGKPFEYKILSEEWGDGFAGKSMTVELQTPDDVAPKVTEADLKLLAAEFVKKYKGEAFDAHFYTVTPLVDFWAKISHVPYADEKLECYINDFAFEEGPWYFPDRIDPKVEWHERVWLTLPMANKIVNSATEFSWELDRRDANSIYFDSKSSPPGVLSDTMYLSPQAWDIETHDGDVSRFVRLVESSLSHLDFEFSQKIVDKLNSVIGTSEYLTREKHHWTWQIDDLEVTYFHYETADSLEILKTTP